MLKKFDLPFGKLVRLSLPPSQSMCIWLYYCMICVALSSALCWSGFSRDACHSLCPVMSWMKLLLGWCVLLPVYFVFMVILISSPWVYDIGLSRPPHQRKQANKQQSSSWFSYFPILLLRLQCHLLFSSVPSGLNLGSWNSSLSYVNCVLVTGSNSAIGEFSHLLQQYINNLSPHWVVVSI